MSESNYQSGEFCWNELATRDVDSAKAFYAALFGWDIEESAMPEGGVYSLFHFGGEYVAGGYEMTGEAFEGVPPHWLAYVHVEDVDAFTERATGLGGMVVTEPMDIPEVGRMSIVRDPGGAMFALYKGSGHCGAARFDRRPGSFCWNELATRDADGAGRFYKELFSWSSTTREMNGTNYTVFSRGETFVSGMLQMTEEWGDIPSHWMAYVAVEDCDAACAKATALGGKICVPPKDIDVGRIAVLNDPTGATFSVIKLAGE